MVALANARGAQKRLADTCCFQPSRRRRRLACMPHAVHAHFVLVLHQPRTSAGCARLAARAPAAARGREARGGSDMKVIN